MDLKALMQKLEIINNKQYLMESEEKETTWTNKSGEKQSLKESNGDASHKMVCKDCGDIFNKPTTNCRHDSHNADGPNWTKKNEGIVFNSSIAQMLLREFGLEEAPIANPYKDPAQAAKFAAMSPADQAWLTKGGGVPDINDPYILARAPNKGKPAAPAAQQVAPGQADRDDAEQGAAMRANAAGGNSTSAATGVGIPGEEAAAQAAAPTAADQDDADMGAAMKANQAAAIGANQDAEDQAMGAAMTANAQAANGVNAAGQNVTMPGGINPETGTPTTTTAGAPAAPTQAASPAAPAKPKATPDPKVMAMQQELIKKGAKIKADGIMGPATAAAQKQFGAARDPAGAYRGDRSDMKPAAPAGGQAASPAKPAPYNAAKDSQAANVAKPAGGQAASPAAPAAPAADAPTPSLINRFRASRGIPTSEEVSAPTRQESIRSEDDEILARIKSAFRF
jgi:hypothetical protein